MTNVALVVLDTLRKDYFDDHFEWLPGTRFERAYSTANWTAPAHGSLFTGRYPSEVDVHAKAISCTCEKQTLPENLRAAGYRTRAFSANGILSPHHNWDRGFEEFHDSMDVRYSADDLFNWFGYFSDLADPGVRQYWRALEDCITSDSATLPSLLMGARIASGWEPACEDSGAKTILESLRRTDFDDREFLFVNLMEAHAPYFPPPEYRTVDNEIDVGIANAFDRPSDRSEVETAYDDAVQYLSHIYERIFEEIQSDFEYIVTVSDHGELLGEHELYGHPHGVYPEIANVPLVITDTGRQETRSDRTTASLLDVHQTILSVTDVAGESRGRHLLGDAEATRRLVEYHGLIPFARNELRESGTAEGDIEELDTELLGVATDSAYHYETIHGVESTETSGTRRPERVIRTERESIDGIDSDESEPLSEESKQRLSDLGYI